MRETQLKIRHAAAVRSKDAAEIAATEKELAAIGVHADWLSDDVMVWRDNRTQKRTRKPSAAAADGGVYPDSACAVCGNPIEKTGKPGRPPTKCIKHR